MSFFSVYIVLLISFAYIVACVPLSSDNAYLGVKSNSVLPQNLSAANEQPDISIFTEGACNIQIRSPRIYTENFMLENDGKSQVEASLMILVSGSPNITCVEIISRSEDMIRPHVISGGLGRSFVEVGVKAEYGKGFDFSVNLYGSL